MRRISTSRRTMAGVAVTGAAVASLTFAPSAWAFTLAKDKAAPVVDESITFTASSEAECPPTYTFTVDDGPSEPPQSSPSFTTSFATPGSHTVTVDKVENHPQGGTCGTDSASLTFDVRSALAGSIAVSPDPPAPDQTATLSATQTGGYAPFTYAWDLDNDGDFDDATTRIVNTVFPTTGPHVVRVQIRDSAPEVHEDVVTRTIDVVEPDPDDPPPPPPPPCVQQLEFALSEFTTPGCFVQTGGSPSATWETTAAVTLNGITFPDFGQTFTITFPTDSEPGGHFSAPDSALQLGSLTVFSGDIDWTLPEGEQGGEETLISLAVPPFAELFALPVLGSAEVRLGWGADGEHYATFSLSVGLPSVFKPAPYAGSGTVTGTASLRVDDAGPHFDGLKLIATDVWIGRIKVPEACFSYVPAGGQTVAPCDAPSLDGEPYIECETDVDTDRWDGNAILELPVEGSPQFAAFGGLADGQVSKLGGFADNLGLSVQLVPGVFLKRIGLGLCLSPPPFKLRGDVGVELLGGKLRVNGRVLYTDPFENDPWSVEVGGNALIGDLELGRGFMTFNAWGDIEFGLSTELNLFDVATIAGQIEGWVEPRNNLFNVSGSVQGCIVTVICAKAFGLISSSGVAGCIDAGTITVYEPVNARTGSFGFGSISFDLREHVIPLKAGFGHRFGTSGVDLLGNSCDFTPYEAIRSESGRAAATLSERIAPGTKAVSLRIHGSDGPPKVIVRGPDGTTITSPETEAGKQRKGRYLLAENETDGTTSVLLIKPAAGKWTIKAAPGATSTPTAVDRSNYTAPATFAGQVRRTNKGRVLVMAYAVPTGTKVRLVERGKEIARTIARDVQGRPCEGRRTLPGGRKLLCARVRFRPSRGPGGGRRVQAIVSRGAIPLARKDVASFKAPRQTLPSRPGKLRARRVRGDLIVIFPRSRGASRYSVIASLGDGRRLGFDLRKNCRAVRIPEVPIGVAAIVRVAGVRYDLRTGRYRRIRLAEDRKSAGPSRPLPRRICS